MRKDPFYFTVQYLIHDYIRYLCLNLQMFPRIQEMVQMTKIINIKMPVLFSADNMTGIPLMAMAETRSWQMSPLPENMGDQKMKPLTKQSLHFCQELASRSHAFTFTLTLGSTFSFSLDYRETTAAVVPFYSK